ncbi:YueI family protein [Selenihalanaerobacter shriftii]|uniref:Uncharacterized protein YueI n=1 Tax=Selenihalanaerobacter shriftii TaxID=142842 RepID=A0A1T4KZY1_9FIRM|nr:YueI family protein [Selenihalanaerobacter shriftii]SJZ47933.1 Uncharacterized protein YueI [Selenihalanaerobacter shriftii]
MKSKDEEIEEEAVLNQNKSKLEKTISAGIHGGYEFKKGEKNQFLGEFRERIIRVLNFKQIIEPGVYPEVLEAIKDSEAKKLIISRKANLKAAKDYIELANQNNLSFKKVDSPEFKGDIGLAVVSDHAVHHEEIIVIDKEEKFKEIGLPVELLQKAGEKICADCYHKIEENAPEELINFEKMSWIDSLFNSSCVC